MCTDGAPVNVKMHDLVKSDLGEHYLLTLCPAHKIELAIRDAFEESVLNNDCNQDYVDIYYLFKKANLRWRLFKRQAKFQGIEYVRYKRPSGTRWVEHQTAALKSHLKNLPIFIGFCNNQIISPHNESIIKIKAKLEGYKNNVCETKRVLFEAIKTDVLQILEPVSKTLQEASLLTPKLLSVCRKVIKTIDKLLILLNREGGEAFHRDDVFPTASDILEQLADNDEEILPERQTRAQAAANPNNNHALFHDYLLKGSVEDAIETCKNEYIMIVELLKEALSTRLESLLENDLFKSISIILDSESYQFIEPNVIYEEIQVVVKHFESILLTNGCNVNNLKEEFELLHDHIKRFISKSTPEKCWPIIFRIGRDLGIQNMLHVLEICLVAPLSNAESERVFSILWRIFSKERQSLKHETLNMLLHIRSDDDLSKGRYKDPIQMFLNEYPDGTVRKRKRHLQGHDYPSNRKSSKRPRHNIAAGLAEISDEDDSPNDDPNDNPNYQNVEEIPLTNISDDEWTSDEEE